MRTFRGCHPEKHAGKSKSNTPDALFAMEFFPGTFSLSFSDPARVLPSKTENQNHGSRRKHGTKKNCSFFGSVFFVRSVVSCFPVRAFVFLLSCVSWMSS
jgi:hypothetical protein